MDIMRGESQKLWVVLKINDDESAYKKNFKMRGVTVSKKKNQTFKCKTNGA